MSKLGKGFCRVVEVCEYLLPDFRSSIPFCSVLSTFPVYSVFSCSRFLYTYGLPRASLAVQVVKKLPAVQETQVQSLGWEDPLGEGKGYPLQYSGLENSVDYIVRRVTKSLKE